jgi:hypothetical protein
MSGVPFSSILIDPASPSQLEYWANELQVEPPELKAAIQVVGRQLPNVRSYLGKTAEIVCLQDRRAARQTKQSTWTAFPPVA